MSLRSSTAKTTTRQVSSGYGCCSARTPHELLRGCTKLPYESACRSIAPQTADTEISNVGNLGYRATAVNHFSVDISKFAIHQGIETDRALAWNEVV